MISGAFWPSAGPRHEPQLLCDGVQAAPCNQCDVNTHRLAAPAKRACFAATQKPQPPCKVYVGSCLWKHIDKLYFFIAAVY